MNTAKAEATLAYELQSNRLQQLIRSEEKQIELVERRKLIEIEQHEIDRKEMELNADVRLPAEAEAYRVLQEAEANRTMQMELAEAEATRIRLVGEAEVSENACALQTVIQTIILCRLIA